MSLRGEGAALDAPPAWTGLVLAGGRSSRMGRDKAGLCWQGRPLLEHMQQLLRDAGAARVLVSGVHPRCESVPDQRPGLGPLGGLHSAALALPDGPLLVVPVDMPRLNAALLRRLLEAPPSACAIFAAQRLPMRLRLDEESRALLARLLAAPQPQRSLRALQQALGAVEVTLGEDAAAMVDCNTPTQWEALRP